MESDIVCWEFALLWTPHSCPSIPPPTITSTPKAWLYRLTSQHYAPHHEHRPSAFCRRLLSAETASAAYGQSWPNWSGLSYLWRLPTKISCGWWWWEWFGGVSKELEQHTCEEISALSLHNLSLPILMQFYRGIQHSTCLAQAAYSFCQVTTLTMTMAMLPMFMMMMMMMITMRVAIYMTIWKLVTTWNSMASLDDAWLELKLTPSVQLSRRPSKQEHRYLGRLRPRRPGIDLSILLCTHYNKQV